MSKKSRYLIIFFCFLFFATASPLIVLYVKGIAFDMQKGSFYKTGILSVRSMPKKANIGLNGKIVATKEGNIRFLKPGEYFVEISAPGFLSWSKRLNISSGLVTWANPGNNKISLFLENPSEIFTADSVTSFLQLEDKIFYTQKGVLVEQSLSQTNEKFTHILPESKSGWIVTYAPPNSNAVVLKNTNLEKGALIYDLLEKKFYRLDDFLFADSEIKKYSGGISYILRSKTLYEVDFKKNTSRIIMPGIENCLFEEENFYFLKKDSGSLSLFSSAKPGETAFPLSAKLPIGAKTEIFADFQKHIFLLADNSLYRINSEPQLIAENISELAFDKKHNGFSYIIGPELFWLDTSNSSPKFIHRSFLPIKFPKFLQETGHIFVYKNNAIVALELDMRDRQNEFSLFNNSSLIAYGLSQDGKHLATLAGQGLKIWKIR